MSAAFILISSKVGDLIGRKRAYVLGLLGLRGRRAGDDAGPEPDRDHHLLGDHRRARRVAAAAGDAVAHPRQLRGRGAEEGLRAGRRGGRDRRGRRAAARRLHHHLPVVARRLPARGRRHRDRAVGHQAGPRRAVHRARARSTSVGASSRSLGMGGDRARASWSGRRAARRSASLLAIGAVAMAGFAWWLVRRKRAGQADAARPGPVPVQALPARDLASRCCSRSPWAAR